MIRQPKSIEIPQEHQKVTVNRRKPARGNGYLRLYLFVLVACLTCTAIVFKSTISSNVVFKAISISFGLLQNDSEPNIPQHSNEDVQQPKKIDSAVSSRGKITQFTETEKIVVKTKAEKKKKDNYLMNRDGTRRRRIAYAITISKDGYFQDGAAVFAYSIYEASIKGDDLISFIAFVHPNVTTSRQTLKKLGFHVIEVPTPINSSAIRFDFLREKIDKNGCCGAAELIKLNSYRLLQYDRVVHMDADTFVANPLTELFDRNYSLIYTTDPNMASYKEEISMPAQGGFLVIEPSVPDYENLINIVMTKEFAQGSGWDRSQIGWFWGGMTVQGVLPYYYNVIAAPDRSIKVDRCIYNTMADTPECLKQNMSEIKSVHFTICQKPWSCYNEKINPLCTEFKNRWFEYRAKAEAFYGIPVNPEPCTGRYHGKYSPMKLDDAVTSRHFRKLPFYPDESPDVLLPIGNTGYTGNTYH